MKEAMQRPVFEGKTGRTGKVRRKARITLLLTLPFAIVLLVGLAYSQVPAVSVLVPYSSAGVVVAELDGDPTTGNWADATSAVVPLENGATNQYGSVVAYLKHDGTYFYVRLDGKVDVPWASATGNHFWLGWLISPSTVTGHHKTGQDLAFFGETSYLGITYPLQPVDAFGSGKPPAKDTSQDYVGMLRYTGASAPYSFTAEWRRALDTGDSQDIALVADGSTIYNFYITTDSDGGGSSGGAIDHSIMTNANTIKFQPIPPGTHDVAVSAVAPSVTSATVGDILTVVVTVANQGTSDETTTIRAYYDNTQIGSAVGSIAKGNSASFNIAWDTAGIAEGTYTIKGAVDAVTGETDTADNMLTDGQVILSAPGAIHDLAVVGVTPSAATAVAGEVLTVTVTVANQGTTDETITVRAFRDDTEIGVASGYVVKDSFSVYNITWDTAGLVAGSYSIRALIDAVAGETDALDNSLTDGQVTLSSPEQTSGQLDEQSLWLATLLASLSATTSVLAMCYMFVSRRMR